jgi:flavin-binding protein dodecin
MHAQRLRQRARDSAHALEMTDNCVAAAPAARSSADSFVQEDCMSNHVYKHIELTGSSTKNIEDAVSGAIAKASASLRNIHWFEVVETRGHVENGKVAHWQVTIKVGFTLED